MAEDVPLKELQRILHWISQNPWNPAAACWFRICKPSLLQLAYRRARLPSCPHSPGLTQSGLRAKADRLLEGKPASIWNITGSVLQLQPAPVPVLFHLKSPGFWEIFNGGTETNLKQKLAIYLQDMSIWKTHNCRFIYKPAYRWSSTEMPNVFDLLFSVK